MARILAIEPNPERVMKLMALIRDHVGADLVVAGSNDAAVAAMKEDLPDVILTPTLLASSDEAELIACLRAMPDAQHVQILTTPLLPDRDETDMPRKGVLTFFRRERERPRAWSACDPDAYARAIRGYLERARALQAERETWQARQTLSYLESSAPVPARRSFSEGGALVRPEDARVAIVPSPENRALARRLEDERRRARRMLQAELPWLSKITLPWGLEVRPLNISSTGVLVESAAKFMPGSGTEFLIAGDGSHVVAPVRVVRSQVAAIDARGVRYHTAAVFEKELDFLTPVGVFSTAKALGRLLAHLQAELNRDSSHARLSTTFVQGLRALVPARDIQIRDVPAILPDDSESIYFSVPRTGAVLQATFGPDYELAESEFRLLKAAAALSTVVVELDAARRSGDE